METSKSINNLVTNNTNTIVKEAVKNPVSIASNINKENNITPTQHSAEITKDIVCTMISNTHNKLFLTINEALDVSKIYEIIYKRVEALKKVNITYKKPPTN